MDSFAANYIKPRGSNLKNMNASVVTNKRQAQMIFTGYERQINAINDGFKTQRGTTIFNGADGPTINNLKNGSTWTPPETLHAIQTTNYCALSNSCPPSPPPTYSITPSDVLEIQYITLTTIEPFYLSYDSSITNTGVVQLIFYDIAHAISGTQIIDLTAASQIIIPSTNIHKEIGYVFRSTPINIPYVDTNEYNLEAGYPYSFTNNSGSRSLTLTKQNLTTTLVQISGTYIPSPLLGYIKYKFGL
jgi:hypothetical protein